MQSDQDTIQLARVTRVLSRSGELSIYLPLRLLASQSRPSVNLVVEVVETGFQCQLCAQYQHYSTPFSSRTLSQSMPNSPGYASSAASGLSMLVIQRCPLVSYSRRRPLYRREEHTISLTDILASSIHSRLFAKRRIGVLDVCCFGK
jgi:hypothetical protein